TVTVNVQNAPNGARLDAWIDFNGDGSWGGPGEQIADGTAVTNGENAISFDVPSWSVAGQIVGRLRLSTSGNLGVGGLAPDGEVEDFVVTALPAFPGMATFGNQRIITSTANNPYSVIAADVDRDGDMDVLSASYNDDTVAWYENDNNSFTAHAISTTS